jgi:hypothetical protein
VPADTGSGWIMRPALVATDMSGGTLVFSLASSRPDSVVLGGFGAPSNGEFTRDGSFFFARSGYVKFSRASGGRMEGVFACEMAATDNSPEPGKVIRVTEGTFRVDTAGK